MELFEDGGLKEEGGMIEPESGNVVPSGSSREEVADDIPAMLSEGEFVFPADVTRYIGLDKLMSLRQDAKMGLAQMESMGQMGEERDASKDEELPFGMADLIVVSEGGEPLEMAEGGVASTRSLATSAVPTRPNRKTTYKEIMGQNRIIFKEYRNAAGESMTIAFLGNVPLYPIPDGYTYYDSSNPDSHPSTGVGGTAPPTQPNILVEEPREYSGELDNLGRPVGSVHTPPNYSTMDNVEFTSAMTTKHTEGLNTDKIALGLISIVAPPVGFVATVAHYKDVQLDIARMEARKSQGNLTAEQTKALDAAIATAKGKIGGAFAKGVLNITDSIAKALGLNPQQIEQYKNNATQATDAAVNTETNTNENVNTFVSKATEQFTFKDQAKIAPSFTRTTDKVVSGTPGVGKPGEVNPYGTTPQQVAPPILESKLPFGLLANKQMITDQSFTPASPSNVADSIIQKSMPTAEFNPVTGQLESKLPFTPVAPPTFDKLVSNKAAVGRPIDRIDPMLGMPMDASMIDTSNIKNINPTLGMPMNPISKPAAGVGYDIGLGDTSISSVAPVTDDYGNAFGKGMANNVTSDFSGAKSLDSQIDMMDLGYGTPVDSPYSTGYGGGYTPKGISDPQPSGIQDPSQVPTYDSQTPQGIQDPSEIVQDTSLLDAYQNYNPYGTTATTSTKQTADSFIDAPTTDSIVSKDNQAFYDAQQQTQDALSFADSLNPQGPTFTPTAPEPVSGTPGVGKPGEVNPYGTTTTAPAAGIGYDIGIGDTGITSSPTLTDDFRPLKAPEKKAVAPVKTTIETPKAVKYKPEGIVPGAYTGSGMNNTISVGGKIAGVTGVEGVVPSSTNPNEVSKVSKTSSSGNTTQHTVFSNTKGDLYAKNPFGTTFSVTKDAKGNFTAGDKTPESMPTDAQPKSIFSGLLSGGTKSTPTKSTTKSTTKSEGEGPATGTSGDVSTGGVTSGVGTGGTGGGVGLSGEGSDGGDGDGNKIVCTEMYRQTKLEDWKNDMKIWGLHTTTHLTPYHQNGYHVLFKPWVRGMRKHKWLMLSGGWLAKRRTQHLKHVLSNSGYFEFGINKNEKDDIVGNIWCKVWHPVSYIVGKLKSIITGKN